MKATRLVAAVLIVLIAIFIYFTPQKLRPQLEAKQTDIPQDLPQIYPYPLRNENFQEAPQISAWSAVVVDAKSGVALYEKNADTRHLPASTTKLMTALAALEQCAPDQPVTVKTFETLPTSMGLVTGDIVTVRTLLYGLLINSGNDAASVLSYSCAPSSGDFVRRMNQKALEFGMHQTHFANPIGFDDPAQFTTARDLAKLARIAVANPLIAKIVATKNMVLTDVAGTKNYYLENINSLLGEVQGIEGIKTGQTSGSLEVLVTKTTRNTHTIIVVVLGSTDRFLESRELIEWSYLNHHWQNL